MHIRRFSIPHPRITACRHFDSNLYHYIPFSRNYQSSIGCQRIFKKGRGGAKKHTNTHTPFSPKKLMGNFNFANSFRTQKREAVDRRRRRFPTRWKKVFLMPPPSFPSSFSFSKGLPPSFYNAKGRLKRCQWNISRAKRSISLVSFQKKKYGFLDFFTNSFLLRPVTGKCRMLLRGNFLASYFFFSPPPFRPRGGRREDGDGVPRGKEKKKREKLEVVVSGVRENEVRSSQPMGHKERRRRK